MSRLILIETSTALCSVSLVEDGKICASRLSETPRAQASLTAVFVDEVLANYYIKSNNKDYPCYYELASKYESHNNSILEHLIYFCLL